MVKNEEVCYPNCIHAVWLWYQYKITRIITDGKDRFIILSNRIQWLIFSNVIYIFAYNDFIDLFRDKLDKVCPIDKIKTVHKVEQKLWITSTLKTV